MLVDKSVSTLLSYLFYKTVLLHKVEIKLFILLSSVLHFFGLYRCDNFSSAKEQS